MFSRFFSLAFGGLSKQDEARISLLLGAGTYTVAIIVVVLLMLLVVRCSIRLKISFRDNLHCLVLGTVCQLLVIATYKYIL